MPRNRATAKKAGTAFETLISKHLAAQLNDDRIERRARGGANDRGDIGGVRTRGGDRVVIECKDVARTDLSGWLREAETERANDGALAGLVVAKRRGVRDPGQQYVLMTLDTMVALINGDRTHITERN